MKRPICVAMIFLLTTVIFCGCNDSEYILQLEQKHSYQYDELEQMVEDFVKKAENVEPKPDSAARIKQYLKLETEADKIEDALERYEDDLEYQIESESLSLDEFNQKEEQKEDLEMQLEIAQDQLEVLFGIND